MLLNVKRLSKGTTYPINMHLLLYTHTLISQKCRKSKHVIGSGIRRMHSK